MSAALLQLANKCWDSELICVVKIMHVSHGHGHGV